jgi:hypothetical protein
MRRSSVIAFLAATCVLPACAPNVDPLITPGASSVLITHGSMVYLARTSAGVIAIDL